MSGAAVNLFDWLRAVHGDQALTVADRLIASHLILFFGRQTGECFPSMETIAEGVHVDVRTVRRAIAALRKAGWLACRRESKRQSYTYKMSFACRFPRPEDIADTALSEDTGVRTDAPSEDMGVRSDNPGPDTGVRTENARPDTGVPETGHGCPPNFLYELKKERGAGAKGSAKGRPEKVTVAVYHPDWSIWANAYQRRMGKPPPRVQLTVDGVRQDAWIFDANLRELPPIPSDYRPPYLEAAE